MRSCHRAAVILLAIIFYVSASGQNQTNPDAPLFVLEARGLYGYTDALGTVIIPPQFDLAWDFSEGLARVLTCTDEGFRWGFIDRTGKFVIAPSFDDASDFSDGLAGIAVEGAWGFIDRTGAIVIKPQFYTDDVFPEYKFSEGFAAVNVGERWGYINKAGQVVVPTKFNRAEPFHEGMAEIEIKNKSGYVDSTGRIIIKPQFDSAAEFSEGLARVNVGYTFGLNSTDPRFRGGLWGYIDKTGRFVITPRYDFADSFSEGLALVRTDNGTGFIDKNGLLVIADRYEDASGFSGGLAAVRLDDKWGYIDRTGQTVIPFQFGVSNSFINQVAAVNNCNNRINRQGEVIWTRPSNDTRTVAANVCEPKVKPPEPTADQIAARRRDVHKLMLTGSYQHDGSGELLYIGDMTSVPALLRVLKDHPPIGIYQGRPLYICTHSHAVAALRKITGEKFAGYAEWQAWWIEYRRSNRK